MTGFEGLEHRLSACHCLAHAASSLGYVSYKDASCTAYTLRVTCSNPKMRIMHLIICTRFLRCPGSTLWTASRCRMCAVFVARGVSLAIDRYPPSTLQTLINPVATPPISPIPFPHTLTAQSLTSGGAPTGLTILSNICTLVSSLGCPSPILMYCSSGGCPIYELMLSRCMLLIHSNLVVSAEPMPMKRACCASSCCWARSLSAIAVVYVNGGLEEVRGSWVVSRD